MRKTSDKYNLKLEDVFSEDLYNRLKTDNNGFWIRLDNLEIIPIPNEVYIPSFDIVVVGVHYIEGVKVVKIHDFTDIFFPFDWLFKYNYIELIQALKK